MNTTTGYLYHNNNAFYSRDDNYDDGNSQSPPISMRNSSQNQSPQQPNFDCDEESQYSLSEFSHIYLVDRDAAEHGNLFNRVTHNNFDLANAAPSPTSTTPTVKPMSAAVNTVNNSSDISFYSNYLEVNQLGQNALSSSRKRAFSFAASTEDSLLSTFPTSPPVDSQLQTTSNLSSTPSTALNGANQTNGNNGNNGNNDNNGNSSGISASGDKQRQATKICRVCGDKAFSYNFNVITCESCKAFFRRNANKEKEIRCPFNEQCNINTVSRRFCQRCRLQKCFRVGMKKEWIMTEEARLEKKQRIQTNRERRLAERKYRSGSAEGLISSSFSSSTTTTVTHSVLPTTITTDTGEQFINANVPSVPIDRDAAVAAAAAAAAHQLLREQQQTTSILLDSSKSLTVTSVNLSPNQSSLNLSNGCNPNNVFISSAVASMPLLPTMMNVCQPSSDVIAVSNSNVTQQIVAAAAQFGGTATPQILPPVASSQQQQLEQIAQSIVTHQQHQLEQIAQTLQHQQQHTESEQKLESMDHESSLNLSNTSVNKNSGNEQQQTVSQTLIEQVAQSLVSQQQQQQFDQVVQSLAQNQQQQFGQAVQSLTQTQQQQLVIGGCGTGQACLTTTTAMCPTFCTTNPNLPQTTIPHSQPNSNQIILPPDATIAAVAAAAAALPGMLNTNNPAQSQQQRHQAEQANLAAVVQAAQLHNHQNQILKQQAAVQQLQQFQSQHIISHHHQAAQQQQLHQQQIAAAVAAVTANQPQQQHIINSAQPPNSAVLVTHQNQPFTLDASTAVAAAAVQQQPPAPPSQTSILPQLMESANAAAAAVAAAAVSQPTISHEMVAVPKEVLIKLVEHKIESDQQQQQIEVKPIKCQCRCQCGRYPNETFIVDRVMIDLLENSSKQCCVEQRRNSTFITTATPVAAAVEQPLSNSTLSNNANLGLISSNQPTFFPTQVITGAVAPLSTAAQPACFDATNSMNITSDMEINADYCKLALGDEENLNELLRANGVWNSEPGETQYGVTESGLRRLIKTINSIATFRSLDRNDQTLLLKHGCESYFVLRGLTSFNESKIPLLLQNGVSENMIGFYKDFPVEWRTNETIILLLGMILLFNPEIPDLNNRLVVTMESHKYQSIMKRVLYALHSLDIQHASQTFGTLLSKLNQLKSTATLCALESVEPIVRQMFEPTPPATGFNVTAPVCANIVAMGTCTTGIVTNSMIIENSIS